eukprot:COSAG01_NODE_44117_length_422_cov_1.108359_1_plen_51_part_01
MLLRGHYCLARCLYHTRQRSRVIEYRLHHLRRHVRLYVPQHSLSRFLWWYI